MSSLKDCLPKANLEALESVKDGLLKAEQKLKEKANLSKNESLPPIEVGNIYKIEADEKNGITPPAGRETWFKHFVVLGIVDDGSLMGCVVFDSNINREHLEPGYEGFFIPIEQGKYSFIDHDSYLDCLKLKPASLTVIRQGKAEGRLTDEDLQEALKLTRISNRNSIVLLRRFNILSES